MAKPFTYDADPDYPLYEVNIESRVPVEALIDGEQHVYPNVKKVVVRYSDKHFTL